MVQSRSRGGAGSGLRKLKKRAAARRACAAFMLDAFFTQCPGALLRRFACRNAGSLSYRHLPPPAFPTRTPRTCAWEMRRAAEGRATRAC